MEIIALGPLSVRVYGLCLAAGCLAALCWLFFRARRSLGEEKLLAFSLLALPLGFLLGRLGLCLVSQGWHLFRENYFFNFSRGGFMLYGALAGVVLAARLVCRGKEETGRLLDALAAPGMLLIAVCRFAEGIIGVGYGRNMEEWFDPWGEFTFLPLEDPTPLLRFPFGIPDYYGDYHFSIFLLEGLCALIFLLILRRKKAAVPGAVFLLGLILYAGAQTTLESLRADSLPKWGFVRVNQLLSGVVLAGALLLCTLRLRKAGRPFPLAAWCGLLACMGVILAMEFALEKKILFLQWMRMDLCYLVMACASLGLILICARVWKRAYASKEALRPRASDPVPAP